MAPLQHVDLRGLPAVHLRDRYEESPVTWTHVDRAALLSSFLIDAACALKYPALACIEVDAPTWSGPLVGLLLLFHQCPHESTFSFFSPPMSHLCR